MFAFSAYYNPLAPSTLAVSLLSDAAHLVKNSKWPWRHACAYYSSDGRLLGVDKGKVHTRSNFHCVFPLGEKPASVLVFRVSTDSSRYATNPPWRIPIHYNAVLISDQVRHLVAQDCFQEDREAPSGRLAACLKVLYNQPNWLMLLQYFEVVQFFG